jgi:hypothetical protein
MKSAIKGAEPLNELLSFACIASPTLRPTPSQSAPLKVCKWPHMLSSRVGNLLSPLLAQHPKIRLFYWQTLLFPGLQALDFRPMTPVINNSMVSQYLAAV